MEASTAPMQPDREAPRGGIDAIRNIGILAHVDAGKTSVTERILYLAGILREAGDVDEGTTATDFLPVERAHGITVKAAAVRFDWRGFDIHLIDTPGHIDFGNEVDRALRIMDGAIIALCAVSGVQARTEAIAKACAERALPRMYFINKMDRNGADFFGVIGHLKATLEPGAVAFQCPVFDGRTWAGVVDLIDMSVYPRSPDSTLPEILPAEVEEARKLLIERLADTDEGIMAAYLADIPIRPPVLRRAARKAVSEASIAPVFCGSAFSDSSVRALLEAVVDLLPSPLEAPMPRGVDPKSGEPVDVRSDAAAPPAAFVFKTLGDQSGDRIAWTRIWSGTLRAGARYLEARSGAEVFIRKIFGIQADSLVELAEAGAGEVVAVRTPRIEPGASICERRFPVVFENLLVQPPVVSQVVEPMALSDLSSIRTALESLSVEDPSLLVQEERETGRFQLSGRGELHLDIVAERLRKEYGLRVRLGNPRVNKRERLAGSASVEEHFDRDFGGARIRLSLSISLMRRQGEGVDVTFADAVRPQPAFKAALTRGVESSLSVGPSEGWPMEGVTVRIDAFAAPAQGTGRDGETATEAAAALACRRALLQAGSQVLEPVMRLDIECPEECFGAALNSVTARGGRIESVEDRLSSKGIVAFAPMSRLFGFSADLRALSSGRADFQARFGEYERIT